MFKLYALFLLISSSISGKSEVPEYDDDNFKEIRQHDISIGMFYSPDCSYCTKFMPHYTNAMFEMEDNDPSIHFFKVNCIGSGKLTCEKQNIPSYPHIKIYIDGNFVEDYEGDRRKDELVKYLKKNFAYGSKELINVAEVENFLNSHHYAVVGYFERCTGLQTAFLKASFILKDRAKFAHITSMNILNKTGLKNNVIMYKPNHFHNKFEEANVSYSGSGDTKDLVNFIKENYHGIVGYRTKKTENDFKTPLIVAYYDIDYNTNSKLTNYWRNRILLVAHKYPNVTFAISNKLEYENEIYKLGLNVSSREYPFILALDANDIYYMLESNFSVEVLDGFVQNFINGNLKPYIKSEPLPEENDDPVKILVGKNFYEIMNNDKDTFIQFYTPWCLVCLEFGRDYEDLALELGDDVVIAKMNVAANHYPSFISIKSYPTFYLSRKGMFNNPLYYNGSLNIQEMIRFIAQHATYELRRYDRVGNDRMKIEL